MEMKAATVDLSSHSICHCLVCVYMLYVSEGINALYLQILAP